MVPRNIWGELYVTHAALPHPVRSAGDSPRRVAGLVTISSTAGRVAGPGAGAYALTRFGVAAFSESLRREPIGQRVRVSGVEPGTVDTDLASRPGEDIQQAARSRLEPIEPLRPDDIADAVVYIVIRDRRVAVIEPLVRAVERTW
jgi:NADP-dependent 3-hydroxy acid dehydrogenase YdfG